MTGSQHGGTHPQTLGPRQRSVMQLLWARPDDFVTVRQIAGALDDELAYTTVMTILNRLHAKGHVERRKKGRARAYRARGSHVEHAAQMMDAAYQRAADPQGALLHFVDGLTTEKQQALRRRLDSDGG